ncbi:DNA-processing protein DprA [Actinomycetes bacterium KLBMP 9797]
MTSEVAISGSRMTEHRSREGYEDLFAEFLAPFANRSGARIFVGGAKGIDSLVLTWLAQHTSAAIVVAVPGTVSGQPAEAQAAILEGQQTGQVDVVELAHPAFPSAAAYHARNRWMVDRSRLLIAFPHGDDPRSGTWYTIGYVAEQGKPRLIVPI